ncbi:MAG: carbon-nitrogen hydrolase family protein [Bacteriovoracaceae bacterium]
MKIAVLQLESKLEPEINLKTIRTFLKEAKDNGAEAAFLPEVFYSISNGLKPTPYLVEDKNEHYQNIQKLASDFGLYLLGGSVATKVGNKIMNRNYNFDPKGVELNCYDKTHLFSCDLSRDPSKQIIDEGLIYTAGKDLKTLDLGEFKLGLSICFDLRFPEMFRHYFKQGCNVMSISAAFTVPTGKAHWHTLLRARAIENQSYIIAPAQWGVHNERIKTYGHSLIVDPWGEILADAGEGEKVIYADLSMEKLKEVRSRLNVPVEAYLK